MINATSSSNTFLYELNVKKGRLDNLIKHIDEQNEKLANEPSNVINQSIDKFQSKSRLKDDAKGLLSLSGYTPSLKVSIWGKLNGLDTSISKTRQKELRDFIESTQILGLTGDYKLNKSIKAKVMSIDEYIKVHKKHEGVARYEDSELYNMLDMYSDINEFKQKWLEFSTRRHNDLRASEELANYVAPASIADVGSSDPQLARRLMMDKQPKSEIITYELEKDPNFAFLKDKIDQIDEKIGLEILGDTEKLIAQKKKLDMYV
ncbi:hypothetical protein [Campylobacter suis]|uniref:Uncharacterized protein n=1 Tax=Campylobacter suis TaxID=2790657 RepID=A0ABM8Q1D0_9BACT|nr:hypothetical protein [Campylobacter suis]CAD7286594.1 hypothetical protein LMG8286_00427 [Campylobacter suis]